MKIRHARSDKRPEIVGLNALTLATRDMARALDFYGALGFDIVAGGAEAGFTVLAAGAQRLNLTTEKMQFSPCWWGRAIFHVSDVDRMYAIALRAGLSPSFPPRDAPWGERYFHISDPDGHEISFAVPLTEDGRPEIRESRTATD